MSRIAELIAKLCPNGIEYVKLGDVCTITKGKTPIQKAIPGEYPLVVTTSERKSCNTYQFDKSAVCIPLVSSRGHGVASLNHVYFQSGKFALGNILCAVIPNDENVLSANFLFHYLEYKKDTLLVPLMKGGANVSLHIYDIQRVKIPLPPLDVQLETIEILDKFVELSEMLTKELSIRKKQYEYYRDLLLDFGVHGGATSECKWRTIKLGDIGKISMCKRIMKSETSPDGDIPFYKIGTFGGEPNAYISRETFEKYKSMYSFPKKGDILISAAGTIGRTVVYDGEPAYYQDSNIVWIDNDETKVINRYLYYVYQLSPWQISTGGTIARLYNDNIANAKINIPSIKEQERIVSILDRFDKLCNDISEGLPAEIEARRKQYEYYRDKLLSFKEQ